MKLVPIPCSIEALRSSYPLWGPFLPSIAQRSKMSVRALIQQAGKFEVRLTLIWDEDKDKPAALIGARFHMREQDLIAEIVWAAGLDFKAWIHLLPEYENLLRQAGAVECRPICRPGWMRELKKHGYVVTHLQMEKTL